MNDTAVRRLDAALATGSFDELDPDAVDPADRRTRALLLLRLYELRTGPLTAACRWAGHPAVTGLQWRLESAWLAELAQLAPPADLPADDLAAAIRTIAARDRLPAPYRWLAETASWPQLRHFLALEGGPDAGFDDLVASCQIGLSGRPKLELASNYWDELGNGEPSQVHTLLHAQLVAALDLPSLPVDELPVAALERTAFCGLLAANHWLQPEMLGALGLIELQAGPRCRLVLAAFDRLRAPAAAYPFYRVHAEVDPRHGRGWVDNALLPICQERPQWAPRILQGAWWRSALNREFFAAAEDLRVPPARAA